MYTSCYSNLKNIPADLVPVGISAGVPPYFKGRRDLRLAPQRAWLKMTKADYDERFAALLAALDPATIYAELEGCILLCWEAPNVAACHRRCAAEWMEQALGVVIPELGFPRDQTPAYHDMPWGTPKKATAKRPGLTGGGSTSYTDRKGIDRAHRVQMPPDQPLLF